MRWKTPTDDGPLTIGTLNGRLVLATCNRCGHRGSFRGDQLGLPSDTKIDDVWNHLKCSKCGSRKVIAYAQTLRAMRQGRER